MIACNQKIACHPIAFPTHFPLNGRIIGSAPDQICMNVSVIADFLPLPASPPIARAALEEAAPPIP